MNLKTFLKRVAFYSLGSSCFPRFLLNGWKIDQPTYFFDWLITDKLSLQKTLLDFSEQEFFSNGWRVVDQDLRVLDEHTGLKFQHDFPNKDGIVDKELVSSQVNIVKSRYIHRRRRLFEHVANDENPVFIRYTYRTVLNTNEVDEIFNIVKQAFNKDCLVLILTDNKFLEPTISGKKMICPVQIHEDKPSSPSDTSLSEVRDCLSRLAGINF